MLVLPIQMLAGNEIDSLKMVLKANKFRHAEEKVETLINLSNQLLFVNRDSAMFYGNQALQFANDQADHDLIAVASRHMGVLLYRQSAYAQAVKYFDMALKANQLAGNDDKLAASYNNLGVMFNRMGYYNLALENHLQQLKINEENGDFYGIANSNLNIGNIYNNMDENEKARSYYLEALKIARQLNDTNFMASTYINLGVANMELENSEEAISYFNKALPIKLKMQEQENVGNIYLNLGVVYNTQEKYDIAIEYFQESLNLFRQLNSRQNVVVALLNLGDANLKLKYYDKSFTLINQALVIARDLESLKLMRDAYEALAEWYEAKGNFELSLKYFKRKTNINDSLLDSEKTKQIRNLQIVYEVEKKEKEILEQNVSIERLKASQFYMLLAIVLVLSLAFVVYYRYRTKQRLNRELKIKIEEALRKQNEQQQIIVHQSSLTSLGELASGIAHEIKQPLQNISLVNEGLQMEVMDENLDRDFIAGSTKDIAEGIKRIKFIINEISNFSRGQQLEIIEWFNVNTRIENAFSLARTRFSNRRIDVKFQLDQNIPEIQGNPYKFEQVVVNFFNNAKDAIEEKAIKTKAEFDKKMTVRSYLKDNRINVEVEDNGIGVPESIKTRIFLPFFTTKDIGKGTGLGLSISLGIVKEMGGIIEIESEEGKGTLMRVILPVAKKQTDQ
jgi:signal transduction histidine kinase/Tfp pilus assembly protein PilF